VGIRAGGAGAALARHTLELDVRRRLTLPPHDPARAMAEPKPAAPNGAAAPRRPHEEVGQLIAEHASARSASSLASLDRPPSAAEAAVPAARAYAPLSPAVLALLAPASVFGTLARLGLQALATYAGQSIFPLAYPQAVGCFIMGVCLALKDPLGRVHGPLYTALTTGFCGSLTTFSGWQYDVFASWDNAAHAHRGWVRDVVDGVTKTVGTLALSVGALAFGTHVGGALAPAMPRTYRVPPLLAYALTVLSVLVYAATLPAYFLLPPGYRHQATAALLFSYPGTLSRYLLSLALNPRLAALPLGTLSANALGTALLGVFHVLQNKAPAVGPHACGLLQGLTDGYCGCLTTVSTFAAEVLALPVRRRWRYIGVSWALGQLLLLVILLPAFDAGGVSKQQRCRFE
jgi:CrcB protein